MIKFKAHFNRVNMQRGNPRVWTACTSRECHQGEKIVIRHNGVVVLETVFKPEARQPRAYFSGVGNVTTKGKTVYVDVDNTGQKVEKSARRSVHTVR